MPDKRQPTGRLDKTDAIPDDLRRIDQPETTSVPSPSGDDLAVVNSSEPSEDGNNAQHPLHDDDPAEDFTADDYEKQIENAARERERTEADITPVFDRK